MKKIMCLFFLSGFLAAVMTAADYSFKFFTPDMYDVTIEVPGAMKAETDASALSGLQGILDGGTLTMDVGRVGSNFNVNYTQVFHDAVMKNGEDAKTKGVFQLRDEAGRTVGEWELDLCWPSKLTGWPTKITGPQMKSGAGRSPLRSIEISFDKATRIK